jgi:hypothetical protein
MDDSEKASAVPGTAETSGQSPSSFSSVPRTDCADDPVILKLLDFEPVQRRHKRPDGWTPALQRIFIAKLAELGSVNAATEALGKNRYGVEKLYKSAGAEGYRKAWDAAIALYEEREANRLMIENAPFAGVKPPFANARGKFLASTAGPLPGQVMNERGEWEDEASYLRRGEEAKDSIKEKLLRCRRLYLMEISGSAGKRAAFEILTELPIDWEKAKRLEPQPDEPWKSTNQRQPDMILTAENGWSFGEFGYGPDRKAELMQALNEYREQEGLPPVEEDDPQPECRGHSGPDHGAAGSSPSSRPQDKPGPRAEARSQSGGLGSTASEQSRPNKGPRVWRM